MSPDWADKPEAVPYSSLDNPQSLNLYGYVNNNPLSKADPDGHQGCCDTADGFFGAAVSFAGTAGEVLISTAYAAAASTALVIGQIVSPQQMGNDPAEARYIASMKNAPAASATPETGDKTGEPPQLAAGKDAHNNEEVRPGEQAEVPTPSKTGRMDRYDAEKGHIREIKPDNARGEKSGQKQLSRYKAEMEKATGKPHTTELTKYPPPTPTPKP